MLVNDVTTGKPLANGNGVTSLERQSVDHVDEKSPHTDFSLKPAGREYIVNCYSYTGPAWLHAGKDGPAWHFEGSDVLVDNDEVMVIRKVDGGAEVK